MATCPRLVSLLDFQPLYPIGAPKRRPGLLPPLGQAVPEHSSVQSLHISFGMMAKYHVGWRSWVEQQPGGSRVPGRKHSDGGFRSSEAPLGWNQDEPTGLCGRKLFGGDAQSDIRD